MTTKPKIKDDLRDAILSHPDAILDDKDVMHALIAANEKAMGHNIIDLRGIAMDRLETRLDRLEDTHRSVIAAAYENVAGTQQIHRAILRLLEAADFDALLRGLNGEVAEILRIDAVRLVLETEGKARVGADVLSERPMGYIDRYLTQDRGGQARHITLRPVQPSADSPYGRPPRRIASEACLKLDLGPARRPGLLVLGSEDSQMFAAQQGTDLLVFFGGVVERLLRRWLT